MEIHETYAKLLKRGMTPPDHLGWDDEKGCFGVCVVADVAPDADGIQPVLRLCDVPDAVACDVITMHAITDLPLMIEKARLAQRWQGGWNLFLDEDYWSGRCTVFKFTAPTILEAILAAIAHLEPR